MIRTIIIDDEKHAIALLKMELENHCPFINIVKTFTNPVQALIYLEKQLVDLVFIDVEMPNLTGIELLKQLPNRSFEVIFVTGYSKYVEQAFMIITDCVDA